MNGELFDGDDQIREDRAQTKAREADSAKHAGASQGEGDLPRMSEAVRPESPSIA